MFKRLMQALNREQKSKSVAKSRLQLILVQDRTGKPGRPAPCPVPDQRPEAEGPMNGRLRWCLLLGCSALALICGPGSTALLVHAFEGPYPAARGGEELAQKPDVAPARVRGQEAAPGSRKIRGAETLVASGLR